MEQFLVRLNCIDNYQSIWTEFSPPLWKGQNQIQAGKQPLVPVIRVFGTTPTGQKVCAHIHGALPYLYVEYEGDSSSGEVKSYIHRLRISIDHALSVSYRNAALEHKSLYVAHISVVRGVPFYGYHIGFKFFLKVYLLNPLHITRLADLLRQGAVMQRAMQPFESHIQYIPQWMCDFNLFGCEYLKASVVKFRCPVPASETSVNDSQLWHEENIPKAMLSDKLPRQSDCAIEVDIVVEHILNRLEQKSRDIHHDLLEKIDPYSNQEKVVHSMAGLWKDETRRRKMRMGMPESDNSPFPPEVLITVSADPRNVGPHGWIHEQEYRDKLRCLMNAEKTYKQCADCTKEFSNVPTVFESVEELFATNLSKSERVLERSEPNNDTFNIDETIAEVDEDCVRSLRDDFDHSGSDHEIKQEAQRYDQESRRKVGTPIQPVEPMDAEIIKHIHTNVPKHGFSTKSEMQHRDGLNSYGIREAGKYTSTRDDAFQVPVEFTSLINSSFPGSTIDKRKLEGLEETNKRQKVGSAEYSRPETQRTSDSDSVKTNRREVNISERTTSRDRSPNSISSQESRKNTMKPSRLKLPIVKFPNGLSEVLRKKSRKNQHIHANSFESRQQVEPKNQRASEFSTQNISATSAATSLVDDSDDSLALPMSSMFRESFKVSSQKSFLFVGIAAPSIVLPLSQYKLPSRIYQDAHFGDDEDVPERAREYAGKEFRLEGTGVAFLPEFDTSGQSLASFGMKPRGAALKPSLLNDQILDSRACTIRSWDFERPPPTFKEVQSWLDKGGYFDSDPVEIGPRPCQSLSQIDGPTQKNSHGAKYSGKQKSTSVLWETQYMSVMSVEIHVNTRADLVPDPKKDEIKCVFWALRSSDRKAADQAICSPATSGVIRLLDKEIRARDIVNQELVGVEEETTELDLITKLVDLVHRNDPDILTGYEVHNSSWGYIIERARCKYDFNLCDELSRVKTQSHGRYGKETDRWGFNQTSTIRVTGRHMINIWRAMRGELNLLQYTLENVVFHLLRRRVPHYSFSDLTAWYASNKPRDLSKVFDYHLSRAKLDLEILEQNELIARTSEQARLLGVDFYSVFSRGSQFKVESLMLRIAKPENFILISPGRKQVGQQNALECLPLVMEPQSAFYTSPLLVLDFQSLYPSVMIAYNYCYSTFLGRIVQWRGQNKMGFTDYSREEGLLSALKEHINISPNGMMYAKPEARKSLLAKMLGEILETRVMVKSGMKVDKDDRQLQRLLNNRQLALKLIANVTYGYTSASFSGRMPCSEIADSIVQTGRETLEKAIALIHSVDKWGAEVVYGDTDSLFVHLKGRTRDEAFSIGEEIAEAVTQMNPRPIKLKFEKVYHPCILLAKKRYVGFKYESRHQKEPEFDAKGIETVRRDGTPAEQKIEETALKILFRTADLSLVKQYFQKQCMKVMKGKVSIQDFCFAREVKLGTYSDRGPPPPGALISARKMSVDPRAEPQYGERIPYVVIAGAPGARLIDRCVAPEILLQDDQNELDAEYYISKNLIPPLERIFNLVGANVRQWYDEMPKSQRARRIEGLPQDLNTDTFFSKKTLESYMSSLACAVCAEKVDNHLLVCSQCLGRPGESILALNRKMNSAEQRALDLNNVCRSCAALPFGEEVKCDSKDCPVFFSRTRYMANLSSRKIIIEPAIKLLEKIGFELVDW